MRTYRYKAVTRVGLSDVSRVWALVYSVIHVTSNRIKPPEMDRPMHRFQRHIKQESDRYF